MTPTLSAPRTVPSLRACPGCGTENLAAPPLPYSRDPWVLKECAGCGFVYLENPPKYEELSETFAWEQTFDKEKERRRQAEPAIFWLSQKVKFFRRQVFKRDKLARLLKQRQGGNLLDVGCGPGAAFDSLSPRFVPHGVEVSKRLATSAHQRAAPRGGFVIHCAAVSGVAQFQPDFFQVAILSSFLEHEAQPRELLKALLRVTARGGQAIIKVPNYGSWNRRVRRENWCGFRFPDHVNYFTPRSLRRMVQESGFALKRFGFGDRFPLSDNMWMIAERP
jgi:SAM-dependent methyltransferase